jgi:DNA repair protein RecO (recombination protein O)
MAWVEMVVYHQEQKEINRVKEVRAAYVYERIPYEVVRGNVGLLMIEWARHCLQEAQGNEALYAFLWDSFVHLDRAEHFANVHLWFIARLAHFLGFLPSAAPAMEGEEEPCWDFQEKRYWTQIPQHAQYLDALNTRLLIAFNELPLEALAELPLNLDWRRGFVEAMFRFYAYHVDHFRTVNSFRILQEVLHR